MKIRYYIIAFIALFMCNTAVFAQERNPNRMVFHKGDKILKTYSVGELDDITFDYVENKEVEISILNVGNNGCKVKFTMPDNCTSYLVGAIPADSNEDLVEYIQKNASGNFTESTEFEFNNLKSGIDYYIMALPFDKYGLSTVLSKQMVKTSSLEYKNETSNFFDVDYWGDYASLGYQNFVIRLGDCPHDGINPRGNGKIYSFSIHCKTADGLLVREGSWQVVLNTDAKEFGGNGLADDSVEHLTNSDTLYAKDHKGWLKLYIPARSAVVLRKKNGDHA